MIDKDYIDENLSNEVDSQLNEYENIKKLNEIEKAVEEYVLLIVNQKED